MVQLHINSLWVIRGPLLGATDCLWFPTPVLCIFPYYTSDHSILHVNILVHPDITKQTMAYFPFFLPLIFFFFFSSFTLIFFSLPLLIILYFLFPGTVYSVNVWATGTRYTARCRVDKEQAGLLSLATARLAKSRLLPGFASLELVALLVLQHQNVETVNSKQHRGDLSNHYE